MGIIDRFRLWLARGLVKASSVTIIPRWLTSSFFTPTFRALISEGYHANSVVFACAAALAFAFPEPRLRVYQETPAGDELMPKHPINSLLRRPNKSMDEKTFKQFCIIYASIGGNAYIWKQRNSTGRPIALWPFHDGNVEPVPGRTTEEGLVREYKYTVDGMNEPQIIPAEDIIHWRWMPDPLQPWRGIGAIKASAREVDQDNEATRYLYALLKNDAIPRVVVTLAEEEEISDERVERLMQEWQDRRGGDRRGAAAFIEHGMKVDTLSLNLQELAFEALRAVPEARICSNFRTPPIIVGLNVGLQRSTFSNYEEARKAWTQDTLVKLWSTFENVVAFGLLEDFGADTDISIKHDIGGVAVLREDEDSLFKRTTEAFNAGYITRGDARRKINLPTIPQDEVYKESLTTLMTPAGMIREEEGEKAIDDYWTSFFHAEEKPYPNEHACRLRDPGDFKPESFRRKKRKHDGKEYIVIMGRLKGKTTMTEQAYRYNKKIWTAAQARKHCKDHGGQFEAASKEILECWIEDVAEQLKGQSITSLEDKASRREVQRAVCAAFQRIRVSAAGRMQSALDAYFEQLAEKVISRLMSHASADMLTIEEKQYPTVDDLITDQDHTDLEIIERKFIIEVLMSSWELMNLAIGVEIDFNLGDPAVVSALKDAGTRIVEVTEYTRQQVEETLKAGSERGWSVDQLASGDEEIAGIRDIVRETYKNRAKTIARTELGTAQNTTTLDRYEEVGVALVFILDNLMENSDENCIWLNGQIRSLEWTKKDHPNEGVSGIKNPLQHPNCVRAFAPEVG